MAKLWSKETRDKIKSEMEAAIKLGEFYVPSIDEAEDRYGMKQRVASEDAIRNFCNGIGDVNPLYRSRDYAKNSIHGGIIAPPHFLNAIAFPGGGSKNWDKLDYITAAFDAGAQWECFDTIREGDEFTVIYRPSEVKDITKEDKSPRFLTSIETIYKNQSGKVVAIFTVTGISFIGSREEGKDSQKGVRKAVKQHYFSQQEVEEWYQLIEEEEIRGAKPRYWEDVNVGDQLPTTHHFFTAEQAIAFFMGTIWFEDWRFRMRETKAGFAPAGAMHPDPETGIPEHHDPWWHIFDSAAQRQGMDRAFCPGLLMESWLGHLITNWMGDSGFLKKMACQHRALLFRGSKAICKGQVVNKYIEGDEHLVDLRVTLEDHEGIFPIPNGSATVVLPSRNMKNWRL